MPLNLATWEVIVKKKYLQSNDFKKLDLAVRAYLRTIVKTPTLLNDLALAWNAWESKLRQKNKTYKTSDRYVPNGALEGIENLVAATPVQSPSIPRSYDEMIRQRDALTFEVRSGGNRYVKDSSGGWKQAIFTQEEKYSCTCACATTYLSKLIGEPVDEHAFKVRFDSKSTSHHDFSASGTTWQPICETLRDFGADVEFHATSNWDAMKIFLNRASFDLPVLFGVQWDTGGSPGGGHAVMCTGKGLIPGWAGAEGPGGGFLIEDPWGKHEKPGLTFAGVYFVYSKDGYWSKANAQPAWGCITGRKTRREFHKYAAPSKIGNKMW